MYKLIAAVLFAFPCYSAFYSFQQNWCGGPGVLGPENNWGEAFYQSSGIQWWAHDPENNYHTAMELQHYIHIPVDPTATQYVSIASADVDGDADNDLIASSGYSNMVKWWENVPGSSGNWTVHTVSTDVDGAFCVGAADMNGNGTTDIVTTARFDDEIAWWENTDGTGTQWTKHTVTSSLDGANKVLLCDIDGDNDTDVVASSMTTTDLLWFENTDSQGTSWQQHTVFQAGSQIKALNTADVDGDGDADILGFYGTWNLVWWENTQGTGQNWAERIICNTVNGITDIAVADLNGDTFQDVVGVKESGYWMISSHMNDNGSGYTWTSADVMNYAWGAGKVDLYDHDNDGDIDILISASYGGFVKICENMDSAGTDWNYYCVEGQFQGAADVCATDIDGDGIEDVAAVGSEEAVVWWKDSSYFSTGWLESTIDTNNGEIAYTTLEASLYLPAETSVQIQLRASNDPENMGEWSDPLPTPCDISGMFPETKYLQYRATLITADPDTTPSVNNIFVHYDELGIEQQGNELHLIGPAANPSSGPPLVMFHTPGIVTAQFSLFDLSGRTVATVGQREYVGGTHCIALTSVPSGTYILKMKAGEVTDLCRIVLLP